MWQLLLSAALCVVALDESAEGRFGVVWPEGPGAAAVLTALACSPVLPCTTYFCRGLSLCVAGRGAVTASLPQAELCPFGGSVGSVSPAGKSKWLVPNLSLPTCCSPLLKHIVSAYGLLWLSAHILHDSGIKSPVKEAN